MVKICHFSDWHGNWVKLPEAELYICTGDMLPNFPQFTRNYNIKARNEHQRQGNWLTKLGNLRRFFGSPKSPVIVVRGNHDFVNFAKYFGGECFEINEDSSRFVEYCGFKIGGFRGIPPIGGVWSDELTQMERLARIIALPADLDIVVSHPPPKGILSCLWGCTEFAWQVEQWRLDKKGPKLCCFGHIHENGGAVEEHNGIKFSNASCAINEIEL